jgi:hypothetical protein
MANFWPHTIITEGLASNLQKYIISRRSIFCSCMLDCAVHAGRADRCFVTHPRKKYGLTRLLSGTAVPLKAPGDDGVFSRIACCSFYK